MPTTEYCVLDNDTLIALLPELLILDRGIPAEAWTPEAFLMELPQKWECSFGAGQTGQLVGFLIASQKPESVHIHRFVVATESQGSGIGTVLLERLTDWVDACCPQPITLKVGDANLSAIRFYERHGFRATHRNSGNLLMVRSNNTEEQATDLLRQDIAKYQAKNGGNALKQLLTEPPLWAILEYRLQSGIYHSRLPSFVKKFLRVLLLPGHFLVQSVTGISLPCTAVVGGGLHIPHSGLLVIHAHAVIGANCCLSHGVTIGISGRGERRGVPHLGDCVYVGANAVVVGKIRVGNDAVIGANSLVNRDVQEHTTVLGVPASVVSFNGSEEYL